MVILEIRENLNRLIGLKLLRAGGVFATRQFYFGPALEMKETFDITVECPWRIEVNEQVITGSEDYIIKADNNMDTQWEEGSPTGHLQEQLLKDLLEGEIIANGDIIAKGRVPEVQSVTADSFGGFRLGMTDGIYLALFPTTRRGMGWMLTHVTEGSVLLFNGKIGYVSRRRGPEQRQLEPDDQR